MKEYSACYSEDVVANTFAEISSSINAGLKKAWRAEAKKDPRRRKRQWVQSALWESNLEQILRSAGGGLLRAVVEGEHGKRAVAVNKLGTFVFDGKQSSFELSSEFKRLCKARQRREDVLFADCVTLQFFLP